MTNRRTPTIGRHMEATTTRFLADIESYLTAAGMDPTTFGKRTMNDPQFVFDLRKGRVPSATTLDKVWLWMSDNEPQAVA